MTGVVIAFETAGRHLHLVSEDGSRPPLELHRQGSNSAEHASIIMISNVSSDIVSSCHPDFDYGHGSNAAARGSVRQFKTSESDYHVCRRKRLQAGII